LAASRDFPVRCPDETEKINPELQQIIAMVKMMTMHHSPNVHFPEFGANFSR
jgi:hypothetical protein